MLVSKLQSGGNPLNFKIILHVSNIFFSYSFASCGDSNFILSIAISVDTLKLNITVSKYHFFLRKFISVSIFLGLFLIISYLIFHCFLYSSILLPYFHHGSKSFRLKYSLRILTILCCSFSLAYSSFSLAFLSFNLAFNCSQ